MLRRFNRLVRQLLRRHQSEFEQRVPINRLNCHVVWLILEQLNLQELLSFERATLFLQPMHLHVQLFFRRKFRIIDVRNLQGFGYVLEEFRRLIEPAGHHIEDLTLDFNILPLVLSAEMGPELYRLLQRHCSNLKHLRCYENKPLNYTAMSRIQLPLLQRLETLEMHDMWYTGYRLDAYISLNSDTLTTLIVDNTFINYDNDQPFSPNILPKNLKTIKLTLKRYESQCLHALFWFFKAIKTHPNVTTITLTYMDCYRICPYDVNTNGEGYLADVDATNLLNPEKLKVIYFSCNLIRDYQALKRISQNYHKIELIQCCIPHFRRLVLD